MRSRLAYSKRDSIIIGARCERLGRDTPHREAEKGKSSQRRLVAEVRWSHKLRVLILERYGSGRNRIHRSRLLVSIEKRAVTPEADGRRR
ncbi:hypothetical protein MRX96_010519 [Rhipicephalus microplus]